MSSIPQTGTELEESGVLQIPDITRQGDLILSNDGSRRAEFPTTKLRMVPVKLRQTQADTTTEQNPVVMGAVLVYHVYLALSIYQTWNRKKDWCANVRLLTLITGFVYLIFGVVLVFRSRHLILAWLQRFPLTAWAIRLARRW